MKTIKIPTRRLEIHQTDDGRRIEWWIKDGEIEEQFSEDEETPNIETGDNLFVGIIHLFTPAGPKEIKFEIEAETIDEAFRNYKETANKTIEDLHKQMEAAQQREQQEEANKIIVPNAAIDPNELHV